MKFKKITLIILLIITSLSNSILAQNSTHVNHVLTENKCPSLDQCDLINTKRLIGEDLRGADLRGADLRGADLTKTDLRGANLTGARGVDLTGAIIDETTILSNGSHHIVEQ